MNKHVYGSVGELPPRLLFGVCAPKQTQNGMLCIFFLLTPPPPEPELLEGTLQPLC